MSELVRFHYWLFDRNEIEFVSIEYEGQPPKSEYEDKSCKVVVKLKSKQTFSLSCFSYHSAIKELNYLTSKVDPELLGHRFDTYMVRQIYLCRDRVSELSDDIKKLMNSFKKLKKKEGKSK